MVDYISAVKLPFTDWKKYGISFLLLFIPFISIITGLFFYGFGLKLAKKAIAKKTALPEYQDWGKLFVSGLLVYIATLIYMIPLIVLAGVTFGSALLGLVSGQAVDLFSGSFIGMGIFTALLGLLTLYILPSVFVHYANKDSFAAAFEIKSVFQKAFTVRYFLVWLFMVVYSGILVAILSLLNIVLAVTVVGPWILSGLVTAAMSITGLSLYGEVFNE